MKPLHSQLSETAAAVSRPDAARQNAKQNARQSAPGDQGWRKAMETAQLAQWFPGHRISSHDSGALPHSSSSVPALKPPNQAWPATQTSSRVPIFDTAPTGTGLTVGQAMSGAPLVSRPDRTNVSIRAGFQHDAGTAGLPIIQSSVQARAQPFLGGPASKYQPTDTPENSPAGMDDAPGFSIGTQAASTPGVANDPATAPGTILAVVPLLCHVLSTLGADQAARIRMHVESAGRQASIWLALGNRTINQMHQELALIGGLNQALAGQSLRLASLVCNGRQLYANHSTSISREA